MSFSGYIGLLFLLSLCIGWFLRGDKNIHGRLDAFLLDISFVFVVSALAYCVGQAVQGVEEILGRKEIVAVKEKVVKLASDFVSK